MTPGKETVNTLCDVIMHRGWWQRQSLNTLSINFITFEQFFKKIYMYPLPQQQL